MAWHQKMGHLNENDLKTALRQETIKGLDFNPQSKLDPCETCIKGKLTNKPRMVVKQAASTRVKQGRYAIRRNFQRSEQLGRRLVTKSTSARCDVE
jgi:hypothetical protein